MKLNLAQKALQTEIIYHLIVVKMCLITFRFLKRIDSYLYFPRVAYAFAELIDNSLAATVENEGDRIIELSLVS